MFDRVLNTPVESTAVYNNKLNRCVKNVNEKVLILNLLKRQITFNFFYWRRCVEIDKISRPGVLCKKGFLKEFAKFTGKHLCWNLSLKRLRAFKLATLLISDSNTAVFSCEFCKNFNNIYFVGHLRTWLVLDILF